MSTQAPDTPALPPPLWQLASLWPDSTGPQWQASCTEFSRLQTSLGQLLDRLEPKRTGPKPQAGPAIPPDQLEAVVDTLERLAALWASLYNYAYSCHSVESQNPLHGQVLSRVETLGIPLAGLQARSHRLMAACGTLALGVVAHKTHGPQWQALIRQWQEDAAHQMDSDLEDLAASLAPQGATAFCRLQEKLSASLDHGWEDGSRTTMVELRALAHHPDRQLRIQAFQAETGLWRTHQMSLAAALNGVKGWALEIATRRQWDSLVAVSARQARLPEADIHSMMSAIRGRLPVFHRYWLVKARVLGLKRLGFYDIFAPVGSITRRWSFGQAADLVLEAFSGFSPDLAGFARKALDNNWIDARPRPGKSGGAWCIDFPAQGESRIMCNFSGTTDSVLTLAHELGHGWHSSLLARRPALHRDYPMTLAETASIFAEGLVLKRLANRADPREALALKEQRLADMGQVLGDILCRWLFETEVIKRRRDGDLTPEELCDIMRRCQLECYGPALDPDACHPWMWAAKSHYYHWDLNLYNYPYAFGQLLVLALSRESGSPDPGRLQAMLEASGVQDCRQCAALAGLDIGQEGFWDQGIDVFAREVEEFAAMWEGDPQ